MNRRLASLILFAAFLTASPVAASAEIVLSQLVVDIAGSRPARQDLEIRNIGPERAYVSVSPAEILLPGLPGEKRQEERDPEKLGILVSPARLILEPGQHKIIRVAPLGAAPAKERVYRLTVKPEVGEITGEQSGLKVLVGYDVLVMVRPEHPQPRLVGEWNGSKLRIVNHGNTSVELTGGRQCAAPGNCKDLAAKRLYAGAAWDVPVTDRNAVEFRFQFDGKTQSVRF